MDSDQAAHHSAAVDVWLCEGLRMPAHRDDTAFAMAGVGKPPMKEPAGGLGATLRSMGI
ncbi:MAG: hypothetical protein GY788_16580 [bacterium]|nr:hypothetical protein [bacterium]